MGLVLNNKVMKQRIATQGISGNMAKRRNIAMRYVKPVYQVDMHLWVTVILIY